MFFFGTVGELCDDTVGNFEIGESSSDDRS